MTAAAHASAIRRVYPSVLGKLVRFTGSLVDAEDAVHDAVERALLAWSESGSPNSPEAWLITVAQNAHRDRQRRQRRTQSHGDAVDVLAELSPWARIAVAEPAVLRGFKDELLRLLFACCDPALEVGESAALALATVVGLSNDEISRAFVVAPRSMEQRLTRARRRLREKGDAEGTTAERGLERLPAVLRAIHLLFNEGYWSGEDEAPIRADLCRLALGLARSVVETYPSEPEAAGLLALLLLHDARREARIDADGNPVALPEQDRSRWDHQTITAATTLLERALAAEAPGAYQTEAAIAAVHCRAPHADATEWPEIAALYELLEAFRPTPAVRVNRAFALGNAAGARRGLELLERSDIDAGSYPYVHLVRGALLAEAGDYAGAVRSYRLAAEVARNAHERAQIEAKILALSAAEQESSPPQSQC
ncbi:MAG: sigma-70 family RNA polymerase sigma factor [Myxococcales bacterium]|nr:sigma-70 family RNA polymerase sigma factor [Myxococcales bacterium]MCB9608289.1 sigma-70 family RNA polymerase sigma factor [Polyangiaceae bacterium]